MSKLIDTHLDGANELVWTRDDVEVARLSSGNVFTFPPGALGGSISDVTAARPTGVAATDTAALQAAIDATPAGGSLMIPGHATDKTVPYLISSPLTVTKHIRIEGASMAENWASSASGGSLNHPSALYGAVIKQVTAATDVIQLSGAGINVKLRNLGLTFDAAIIDTNTGHGINAYPSLVNGSGHDSGLMGFLIENVSVLGCDGNHYGLQLRNPLYGLVTHFRSYRGGGLLIDCDSFVGNFGNLVFEDTYCEVINSGTADAYRLQSRTASGSSSGHLNMITFQRPQANITGAAQVAGTQKLWNSNGGSNLPTAIYLLTPDLETAGSNPVDFGGINSGTFVQSKGGLINGTPTGGYDATTGYQAITASGNFIVPDGVYKVRVRCVGGGGGGGGGGSNSAAAANVGGGGGGAGMVTEGYIDVTPRATLAVVVGAVGTHAAGGTAGGNAGGNGSSGGQTTFGGSLIKANGGGGGIGGGASSTTGVGGGAIGGSENTTTNYIPGFGGPTRNANGWDAIATPPGVCGGAGGGAATAAKGGLGGGAATSAFPTFSGQSGGSAGGAAGAAGGAGTTATTYGCGGGGGGGAITGGAGGDGGDGAAGLVEIWW